MSGHRGEDVMAGCSGCHTWQTRCHARETSIQQLVLQVASLFWALSTYHLTLGHPNPRAMPASNCTGSGDRPVEKCQINLQHSSFKKIIRSTFTFCAAPHPKHHKIQTWIAIHSPDYLGWILYWLSLVSSTQTRNWNKIQAYAEFKLFSVTVISKY